MPVMIRLSRQGAKKHAEYQIIAIDKMRRTGGTVLARLGFYYPAAKNDKDKVKVDLDAVKAWKAKGALVSERVGQLLKLLSQ